MPITRFANNSTNHNRDALMSEIADPGCVQVILFASQRSPQGNYSDQSDGPVSNLPLLSALVEKASSGQASWILFDGLFLTAARKNRYQEVEAVLNAAVSSNKAVYCRRPVGFTSGMSPADAQAYLIAQSNDFVTLDIFSRPAFFSLLSDLTEQEMRAL